MPYPDILQPLVGTRRELGNVLRFCVVQVHTPSVLFVRSIGRLRAEPMAALIQAVGSLDAYRDVQILHDMRLVDFDVPVSEAIEIARTFPPHPRTGRLATVAGSAVGFGMLRVIVSIRENVSRHVSAFHTVAEALEWLDIPSIGNAIPSEVENILATHIDPDAEPCDLFNLVIKNITTLGEAGSDDTAP